MLCDNWLEYMQQRGGPVHANGPFQPDFEWCDSGNGKRVGVLLTAEGDDKLAVAGHGVFVTDAFASAIIGAATSL